MNILIYRYNSICEPDIISAFCDAGLTVLEETYEMHEKRVSPSKRIELVEKRIKDSSLLFVFSINFFPDIAKICHIYKLPYLCWTVDSPVPELFSEAITYPTSHIFLFDYEQYLRFSKYNKSNIHYLPLGANTGRFDKVINSITSQEQKKYSHDISFVGSLYSEKNPMHSVHGLSDYSKGYIHSLVEASLKIYGANIVENALTTSVVDDIKFHAPHFYSLSDSVENSDPYIAAHYYIGPMITEAERCRTLNMLASHFDVDLYTQSDTSSLKGVHTHGGVNTLFEMPKIFHLSKINLNMTSKPIISGLPLRIFDIMGCGGFVMSNYQYEIPEYFEIGAEIETYKSIEELVDKCEYYLGHEEARQRIALNGYRKVCEEHTYAHRIMQMIRSIT